jgi:NodT family efflux transporter outer membrane factor (OMF) lipoprotein
MKRNNIKYASLLLLIMLSGLSSCQIFNKYEAPKADTTGLFRDTVATDTTTIADIPWKEYFKDSNLQALIQEGLANNSDLKIAYIRIQQAEANLGMARAAYFPNVALVGDVQQTRNSLTSEKRLGSQTTQYTLGISATWEADIWGKLNRQSRAKYAQFLNSQAYRNLVQTSLIANIATSYYTLLALDEQLKITTETVELLKESTATMQSLMDAGMQNAASVKQSEALLYQTEVSIPDLKSQIRQTENAICVLLGRKPGSIVRSNIQTQTVVTELQYGVPAQMLAKRPDVQQAELNFRTAFELTNVARANFYPSITLNTGSIIGYSSNALSHFFQPENLIANILGSITQPLFAQKQLTGNLKIAKAQQEEALITFRQTVLAAGQEVSDILYGYESSLSKNETRTKQVKSLTSAVDYTKELLIAGEANYTEVLSAEQNLLQAQLQQVNDKLEQLQYSVSLYKALGGGVK